MLNKAKKSTYHKDKVFVNLYNELEDKNFYQNNNLALVTPLVNKKSNIDHSTFYSIAKPFELFHDDIAELNISSSEKYGLPNTFDCNYLLNQFVCTFSRRVNQSQVFKILKMF